MTVTIDPSSGFCFGVASAIERAEKILSETDTVPLYCLGDIVHNSEEINRLKSIGLITIDRSEFEKMHDITVLIRAHGEPPSTYNIAAKNNITLIDATCPIVLSLQKKIKQGYEKMLSAEGQVIIYGKYGHAEVVGLNGQIEDRAEVVTSINDLKHLRYNMPTMLFSQTTMNSKEYCSIAREIKQYCKNEGGALEVVNSICRSMSTRAEKLAEFAKSNEAIIFVSDKKSSNGQYLYDVCKENNDNSFFITSLKEIQAIKIEDFLKYASVGICGATSTPRWLMEEVACKLRVA
ncbi:MAG: 4-hydroxy-3-methylbut-2-enyl diphosphate reductase [Bacteroidales bacterium]|jgi:4-hydroxy-3-methylbut-2-enyl diphosphate reductase|nr:4-hydroxy-3-methylbut-2-enyl diphosphate reductase [Bacteroidales bacterium]